MSADLLAAFADGDVVGRKSRHNEEEAKVTRITSLQSKAIDDTWQSWPKQLAKEPLTNTSESLWKTDQKGHDVLFDAEDLGKDTAAEADEDDFGDFEEADTKSNIPQQTAAPRSSATEKTSTLLDLEEDQITSTERVKESHSLVGFKSKQDASLAFREGKEAPAVVPGASNDLDDDWGDFEDINSGTTEPISNTASSRPSADSITKQLTDASITLKTKQSVQRDSSVALAPTLQQPTVLNDDDDFDTWEDFEDVKLIPEPKITSNVPTSVQLQGNKSATKTKTSFRDRPTNIPPPAVLLSLISQAFATLASLSKESATDQDIGVDVLVAYKVCARAVAGRFLRWKRDTVLSQSMRIGAAGRSGGMKLTALDKGESRREDQEVEEVVATWSKHSHRLNAALIKSKVQKPPISLSSNLVVRTASGVDVLTATHACPLCGLKRNERVNGIDLNVSDTFGEFWVEHWGHKDCYDFWYEYKDLLGQR